jgi:protein-S-isoprenylcysteine O-methyltransferase Ste14
MSFTTISVIVGVILLAIFFLIARLAIRWAVRLTIVGVILVALTGVGIFWWWGNRLASPSSPSNRQRPAAVKRSPAR